jgi:ribosomal protein S27E
MYYLRAVCGSCGHRVRVSVEHAGRRAKCPKCTAIITFPASAQAYVGRTDTELTREAQAKAGATDDVITTSQLLPELPPARIAGRGTTLRVRPVVHAPKRQTALIVATLVGAVAILAGMAALIFNKSDRAPSTPPEPPPAVPVKAPPPPPAPPPDPHEAQRSEIMTRLHRFVKVFNTNDLNKLVEFYDCDIDTLRRAFGALPIDMEVRYENHQAKSIDFAANEIRVTLVFDRVLTNTETKKSEKQEGAERVLTWTRKEKKWVISGAPQP